MQKKLFTIRMNFSILIFMCSLNLMLYVLNLNFWRKTPLSIVFLTTYLTLPFLYAYFDVAISIIVALISAINLASLIFIYKKEGKFFNFIKEENHHHNISKSKKYILVLLLIFLVGISVFQLQYYKERIDTLKFLTKENNSSITKITTDKADYTISKGTPFINSYNIQVQKK